MMRRAAEAMHWQGVVPTDAEPKQLWADKTVLLVEVAADVVEVLAADGHTRARLSKVGLGTEDNQLSATQLVETLVNNMHQLDSPFGRTLLHLCRASVPFAEQLAGGLAQRALVLGEELVFGVSSAPTDAGAIWRPAYTHQQKLQTLVEFLSAVSRCNKVSDAITPRLEPMWTCCG
jgi:hypothetical protein